MTKCIVSFLGSPQCGMPEQPVYGTVKRSGARGETAVYSCIPGYTMRGNASRQCTWAGWQGEVPECTGEETEYCSIRELRYYCACIVYCTGHTADW